MSAMVKSFNCMLRHKLRGLDVDFLVLLVMIALWVNLNAGSSSGAPPRFVLQRVIFAWTPDQVSHPF